LQIDGAAPPANPSDVTGFYEVKDGRWVFLHCRFRNFVAANLSVLGIPPERRGDKSAVVAAAKQWDGKALEDAILAAGGCGGMIRSEAEWLALPQSSAVADLPLMEIVKIGEAPIEPLPPGDRPLSGIRVIDITRVLAGPTCARTLAEHGADVIKVAHPDLPDSGILDLDTGLGKLSSYIDLTNPAQLETMRELVRTGDVFSQSYRPGSMAARGLSPEKLAELRPGIVYVTLSAWSHAGPWAGRRGYDTVVQTGNGMAWKGEGEKPAFIPASAQDYTSGYMMSFGAMVALRRRAIEGGSWMVRVSLAQTGHWIRSHGLVDAEALAGVPKELPSELLGRFTMHSDSYAGRLTHLAPAAQLSETPGYWARPSVPLGTHPPVWPER
jgi:crotonobetainyl-CoA:carnitine CoA-transferase CaiB-like acyl-CoA transferase